MHMPISRCAVEKSPKGRLGSTVLVSFALWLGWLSAVAAQPVAFNCGGGEFSAAGQSFLADRRYSVANRSGYVDGQPQSGWRGGNVEGTQFVPLFRYARSALTEYRFDLPAGTYLVKLGFAETVFHGPDQRRFSVLAEGVTMIADLDIFAAVEEGYAITFVKAVTVLDGQLNLAFLSHIGQPVISTISVAPATADTIAPRTPVRLTARGGYHRNILVWPPLPEHDLAGYAVYRAPTASGPFTLVTAGTTPLNRYLDDAASAGERWFYRVHGVDVWGNEGPPGGGRATVRASDESTLPSYQLTLAPDQLALLQADPFSDSYASGDFVHRGVVHEEVGIRFRGNVTRHQNKKSWKINFPAAEPFLGADKLNLNAEIVDTTMLKERICFQLLAGLNVRAPRCWFAHVEVNGEFRGVFSRVENIDLSFVERRRLDLTGSLYKADSGQSNFQILATTADYERAWDQKAGEDHQDLIELIELINNTPEEEFARTIAAAFDVDSFLDYYALLVFSANFDHVVHNYYVYHHPDRDIWELFPKDYNGAFGDPHFAINYGTVFHPGGPGGGDASNVLLTRILWVPLFRQRYVDKLLELIEGDFSQFNLDGLIDEYFAEIEVDGLRDVFKIGAERDRPFVNGPQGLKAFVSDRLDWLIPEVAAYQLGLPKTIVINELVAANSDGEDWIELYNPGATAYDLSGHFLTDDLRDPFKWSFAPGTAAVPAGGHLLIAADGGSGGSGVHAGFRLQREGEAVGLLASDGSLVDFIAFGPQVNGISFGRRFDGSALWSLQGAATPGMANTGPGNTPPRLWGQRLNPQLPMPGQAVAVTVMIEDDTSVVEATLWSANGAEWVATPLADDGHSGDEAASDSLYGGIIAGAAAGTTVSYYIEARDELGLLSRDPDDGRSSPHTYVIASGGGDLFINELLAANDSTSSDEHGDFDDWFELYNAGSETLDLAGMYLTDDFSEPDKWQIPAGTIIAPGAYLLFWADGEESEGARHTSFKLSADGEELGLFEATGNGNSLVDGVFFAAQEADISYGRVSDGGSWGFFVSPTPAAANCYRPRQTTGRHGPR